MTSEQTALMSATRTKILGAALIAIGPVTMALYTPAMPLLAQDLHTTESLVKLTLTTYFFGFAFAQLICGPLTDAFGRRPITLLFLALYFVSTVAATMAQDVHFMMITRAIQGIGAAVGITVSRAIVRDQYVGHQAATIMNAISTMLAIGPAVSPTLGGFILELFGWREIFYAMLIYGVLLFAAVLFFQPETNAYKSRDNIHVGRLVSNYTKLLTSIRFLRPSLLLMFSLGTIYSSTTILPFVLIHNTGLTPSEFGLGMLLQTAGFFIGTLVTGKLLKTYDADTVMPIGLTGIFLSALLIAGSLQIYEPSYLVVMVPMSLFTFSCAFVIPSTFTAALRDFPEIAGAASAMMGFLQFGGGILGSTLSAYLGDPLLALMTVIPLMNITGVVLYVFIGLITKPTLPEQPQEAS